MRTTQTVCRHLFILLLLTAAVSVPQFEVWGQIPTLLNYQGVLTDPARTAVPDGNYSITFRLYTVETGGVPLWVEKDGVDVEDGIFEATLGLNTPITLPFDEPYWLGLEVEGGPEMAPRIRFVATPYAMRARNSEVSDVALSLSPTATGVVRSVNGLEGGLTVAGDGIATVTSNGSTITIMVPNLLPENAQDGDLIRWNATSGTWEAVALSVDIATSDRIDGDGSAGSPLDIARMGALNGQHLIWDATANAWRPGDAGVLVSAPLKGEGTMADPVTLTSGSTAGQMLVWNGTGWKLTAATAPNNNDALLWDATAGTWKPGAISLVGSQEISGTGTAADPFRLAQQGATEGQVLRYDPTTGGWRPGPVLELSSPPFAGTGATGDPLRLVDGTTPGQILFWNGTTWTRSSPVTADEASVLTWNSATSAWEPKAVSVSDLAALQTGSIWYGGANDKATELPIGTPGQVMTVNSSGTAPAWSSLLSVDSISTRTIRTAADAIVGGDLIVNGTDARLPARSVDNRELVDSAIAINYGPGVEGDPSVSLGGTLNIRNSGVVEVQGGDGVMIDTAAGVVTVTNTGVTEAQAGTGIGLDASTGIVTITNTGVTSVTGTPNQVVVDQSTGDVTLALPQDIDANATPTFDGLTLDNMSGSSTSEEVVVSNGGSLETRSYASLNPGGILPTGTTPNTTLRWNGTAWVENTGVTADGTGNLTTTGDVAVGGNATVAGDETITGDLTVNGTAVNLPNGSVDNAELANSSINVAYGTGLAGDANVALGGTLNLQNTGVTEAQAGTGISLDASTGTVTITNTGVTSATAGNGITVDQTTGDIMITNNGVTEVQAGTGISLDASTGVVTITNDGVTSLTGTSNQVIVDQSTGDVTLSLPQNIDQNATPTFDGVTLDNLTGSSTSTELMVSNGGAVETRSFASLNPGGVLPAGTTANTTLRWNGTAWVENTGVTADGTGNLTTTGDVAVGGNAMVAGDETITGDLTVNGTAVNLPNGSVDNAELANSSINVAYGTGLSGDANVALGGTLNLQNTGVTDAQAGTGISLDASTGTVTITNTGVTSATAGNGITVDQSTGDITITNNGVTEAQAGNGISLDVSTGVVTITNDGVTSLTGTSNQVIVDQSTGDVTLSLPQNIDQNATPTFDGVTLDNLTGSSTSTELMVSNGGAVETRSFASLNPGGVLPAGTTANTTLRWNGTAWVENTGVTADGTGNLTTTGDLTVNGTAVNLPNGSVDNAELANSSINVAYGTGLSGDANVALGGTLNLQNTGVTDAQAGNGISLDASTGTVTITNTGVTSATAGNGITVDQTTGDITITNNGVTEAQAGTGISLDASTGVVTITNDGVTSLTGTSNQVIVDQSTGDVTLSLPQNIDQNATPTFDGVTLDNLNTTSASDQIVVSNAGSIESRSLTSLLPGGVLPVGSSANSTLRWNGTAWVENTGVTADGTGNLTTTGDVAVGGNATVAGDETITGDLTVNGTAVNLPNGSVDNAELANSSINVAYGTGLAGDANVALGGTLNLQNTGVTDAQQGTGISLDASTGTVTITNTGVTSATAGNGITVDQSTGDITITNNGVTEAQAGTGISVDNSTGVVTITNDGVTSLTGTSNQVIVDQSTGDVTLSLPQNIDQNATPTFDGVTLDNLTGSSTSTELMVSNGGAVETRSFASLNPGGVLPAGTTANTTLRWNGTAWVENTGVTADGTGNLTTTGDVAVGGNATVAGDETITGDLTVNGTAVNLPNGSVDNAELANSLINVAYGTGLSGDANVALGGTLNLQNTGVTSATAGNGITVDQSTGDITITNNGVTEAQAGTGISLDASTGVVTITNDGVTSLTGTSNQVIVDQSTGDVTLSLPQNIDQNATPTFDGVTLDNLSGGSTSDTVLVSNGGVVQSRTVASIASEIGDDFWKVDGNAGTTPGTDFIGTTDAQALEIHVDNDNTSGTDGRGRVMRYEPAAASPNIIGGYQGNSISSNLNGVTIAGGGNSAGANTVASNYSTVSGGRGNTIGSSSDYTAIGGGESNTIGQTAQYSSIDGGRLNKILDGANWSTIGAGEGLVIMPNARESVIAGGHNNRIDTNAYRSFTGAGGGHIIGVNANDAAIVSGLNNRIGTSSFQSFIGAGSSLTIGTSSQNSFVGSGGNNSIGNSSRNSFIGGGFGNQIANNTPWAIIGGGEGNYIAATSASIPGGTRNTIETGAQNGTIGGGDLNVIHLNAGRTVIAGGISNEIDTGSTYSVISGGTTNVIDGTYSVIAGGGTNIVAADNATISGGTGNEITSAANNATIGGGNNNLNEGDDATISGGSQNAIGNGAGHAVIGGGLSSSIGTGSWQATIGGGSNTIGDNSWVSTIAGGNNNSIGSSSAGSAILGGSTNSVTGRNSAIVGGRGLTINGAGSFGFLGNNDAGSRNMSVTSDNTSILGNTDLWLANNDNGASALRFYEANSTIGAFPGTTNYSSFAARPQSADINYLLPDSAGIAGDVLAVASVAGSDITLDWVATATPVISDSAWSLTGNAGTTPGTNFIGTTDAQAFQIHVDNGNSTGNDGRGRVLRFEPNATSANIIAGYQGNSVASGVVAGTISGGGYSGSAQSVSSNYSTIGGGARNGIGTNSSNSTIAGGFSNSVQGSAQNATVAGGLGNTIVSGDHTTVSGGFSNDIRSGSFGSTISGGTNNDISSHTTVVGGGNENVVGTTSQFSMIGGGHQNRIGNGSNSSTIAGGVTDTIEASAVGAAIGGGTTNVIRSNSTYGVIAGGNNNSVSGDRGTIGGGSGNQVLNGYGTIAGGGNNTISASYGVISGGEGNEIEASSNQNSTIGGGRGNLIASGSNASVIGGGLNNTIDSTAYNSSIGAGNTNIISNGSHQSFIGGGGNLTIGTSSQNSFVGSGQYNVIGNSSRNSFIGGGFRNTIADNTPWAIIGGGEGNYIAGMSGAIPGGTRDTIESGASNATIGGGDLNIIRQNATRGVIAGGLENELDTSAAYSIIAGGWQNRVDGQYSTIAGGREFILEGDGSFGFLANVTGAQDMTVTADNTAVFGNTDLWLANNDNTASQLRFYEENNTTGAFPSTTNYSSFAARPQSADINYLLPDSAGIAGDVLAVASIAGTDVTLDWVATATPVISDSAWSLTGNAGTTAGTNYIGTSDATALHVYVNGGSDNSLILNTNGSIQHRTNGDGRGSGAIDLQSTANATQVAAGTNSVITGGQNNTIEALALVSVIGGGTSNMIDSAAPQSVIVGGNSNVINDDHGFIGGGSDNTIDADYGVIAGGDQNSIGSGTRRSVIGGGFQNSMSGGESMTIAGGRNNTVTGDRGTIGGGSGNQLVSGYGVIGGGDLNTIHQNSTRGVISGGRENELDTGSAYSIIGGGWQNRVDGQYSTIAGGRDFVLEGDGSFGFLANVTGSQDMTVTADNTAVFGNTDLWLVNNDNGASALRFYEANSTVGAFPGTTNYSSFAARPQSANINYLLPDSAGIAGDVLAVASVVGSDVTLDWVAPSAQSAISDSAWSLTGNAGTTPGTNFIGTSDAQAFQIHVDNANSTSTNGRGRVMRFEPNNTSANIIGGFKSNSVGGTVVGATIAGGGRNGNLNSITADYGVISGGYGNSIAGSNSVVGGGTSNTVGTGSTNTIGGGNSNLIESASATSVIGGGSINRIRNSASTSVIAGGSSNLIDTSANTSVISGGSNNLIDNTASTSVIAGGSTNSILSTTAVISGGDQNDIGSSSRWSAIVGGHNNNIGDNSFESHIGAGEGNDIGSNSVRATVGGGSFNDIGTSSSNSTIGAGYGNIIGNSADRSTIGGGMSNAINSGASISTIAGGFTNVIDTSANTSTIGGGSSNMIDNSSTTGTISGGSSNMIASSATRATIGGGFRNYIATGATSSVINGGESDTIETGSWQSTISGGTNKIGSSSWQSTISGGGSNTIGSSSAGSVIGGGAVNSITGRLSVIPGGRGLTLNGAGSFAFLGNNDLGARPMTLSSANTTVFANTDLWLANNDNGASALRFYEANNTTGAFPGSTNYSSFAARAQAADINYLLPDSAGIAGDVLAVASVSGSDVTLDWVAASAGSSINVSDSAWSLTGNAGTTPGTNFIGTSDAQAFQIHVDNGNTTGTDGRGRVMRFEPNATSANIIGGYQGNSVASGVVAATISGGGYNANSHTISSNYGTVGGGARNSIGSNSINATIAGGVSNAIQGSAGNGTIAGGLGNTIVSGDHTTISGGFSNDLFSGAFGSTISGGTNNDISSHTSVIGGGDHNTIGTSAQFSMIAGGHQNRIANGANTSTIAGGESDTIEASAFGSTIGGGYLNVIRSSSTYSVITGGRSNVASGSYSSVLGGRGLTLSGAGSVGFLGNNASGSNDMSVSTANSAVFGNTDLWLANNDNSASQLRFYEANSTTGAFPGSANYTAIVAGTQAVDITYTLPTAAPTANGQVLTATTGGAMSWSPSLALSDNNATTPTLTVANTNASGTGLHVTDGTTILAYGNGTNTTIPSDVSVWVVDDNGVGSSGITAALPASGTNGQFLYVMYNDADNGTVGGATATTGDTFTFIYANGAWVQW